MDTAPGDTAAPVRDLADQLRRHGVVTVSARSLASSHPEGLDLIGTLPLLARELAGQWLDAATVLPRLDRDRLQVRSAAALLEEAATAAAADAGRLDAFDVRAVARCVALRTTVADLATATPPEEPGPGNALIDRTWAVLCDLRRCAARGCPDRDPGPGPVVVPSAAQVDPALARALPRGLARAAAQGAMVGLLGPWLPAPITDGLDDAERLLLTAATLARHPQDDGWWESVTALARIAASLSTAAAYAAAGYAGTGWRATSLVLAEIPVRGLVEQAIALTDAAPSAGEPVARVAATAPQQARAAAERAAAERRASQQAFVDRTQAHRASAAHPAPAMQPAPALPGEEPRAVEESAALVDEATDPADDQREPVLQQVGTGPVDTVDLSLWERLMHRRP